MRLQWTIAPGSPLPLVLAIHTLAHSLEDRAESVIDETEEESEATLLRVGSGEPLSVGLDGGALTLRNSQGLAGSIPLAIDPALADGPYLPSPRPDSSLPPHHPPFARNDTHLTGHLSLVTRHRRFLFSAADSGERRSRMTLRTLAELKRRREGTIAAAFGRLQEKSAAVDEEYADIAPLEALALLVTSSAVLDCVDEDDRNTVLALAGAAAGVPVITHASAPIVSWRFESVIAVAEWSADAFADAVASCRSGEGAEVGTRSSASCTLDSRAASAERARSAAVAFLELFRAS